ncbi:putative Fe-S oxidoreductase [Desulfosporosinus orientis DSM 765]|uniref:Putative Fe-S oxidoreductase n=1 Tax=Desulfosporosinus orientis (strain ATCC 19365 / DSM 765 / NCIMB 8382 / VKM B-1628 / Singapore I) TaxID=768706 RepID=G7W6N7_DESOD|nr:radical SAM protein [Desulfosporosinus orientis]AET69169.1 putative Fe-S oxidoreductase [Desulfosporosinus orientis DSM 765]
MGKIKEIIYTFVFKRALHYAEINDLESMRRLLHWIGKITTDEDHQKVISNFQKYVDDPSSSHNKIFKTVFTQIAPNVRNKFLTNFFIKATLFGREKALKTAKIQDCNIPWAILMDPTSSCNLNCIGCWASEYSHQDSLSFAELNHIIEQGKELGIFMYIYSGGEPLLRKTDLVALAEKHQDCAFLAFTNGTLVDEDFTRELVRVGNFVLAFSIEGIGNATDMRRGIGTYDKVIKSMDLMKEAGAGFGYSCCYHRKNIDAVASDEFVDLMIEKGSLFAWYFTYIPLGKTAAMELVALPHQREYMYHRIREIRNTKPLFALDFWNDGEYTKGCIAGGRNYFHINAHGDVEPCAFIHYSNLNIKDSSLLNALKSPLFEQYRENQPFNQNHLRPCPLLDNPDKLAMMVNKSGAHSTQQLDMETVEELTEKVYNLSVSWGDVADSLWEQGTNVKKSPSHLD